MEEGERFLKTEADLEDFEVKTELAAVLANQSFLNQQPLQSLN